jgi:hypothetical protein
MERAPLRPVPARPAGPIDPAAAIREVGAALPALDPLEARAFALVALADRPRAEVAGLLAVEEDALGALLAAARKELRQTITPLAGSGWCERAEGLISDRLDAAVSEPDARRLDVHLRNCPRCVEHERRLVQATDALLAGIAPGRPGTPAPSAEAPLAAVPPEGEAPSGEAPADSGPANVPPADATFVDATPADATPADATRVAVPEQRAATAAAPAESAQAAAEPASPTPEQIAAAAEVLVTARTRAQLAAAITWNAMIAIAVILMIASIALVVAGILGAQL